MMMAYVNTFKPKPETVKVDTLLDQLDQKCWGDPIKKISYSPLGVLANKSNPKYKDEIRRIKNANLRYPIMMHGKHIIDGMHRLSKAKLEGKKTLKAYVFTNKEMSKFLLNKNRDYEKVDKMGVYEYLQLFHKRFC
jgi:hypothetical protein